MKNLSKIEKEQISKGVMIEAVKQATLKAPFKTKKTSFKVYPFFEEKTFKNKNKVYPGLILNNGIKYICIIVKNKIISISSLEFASDKFKNFSNKF